MNDVTTENWGKPFTREAIERVFPRPPFLITRYCYDAIDIKGINPGWIYTVDTLVFCISGKLIYRYEDGTQVSIEASQVKFLPAGKVSDGFSSPPVEFITVKNMDDIFKRQAKLEQVNQQD